MAQELDKSFKYMSDNLTEALIKLVVKDRELDFSTAQIKTREEIASNSSIFHPDFIIEFNNFIIMTEFESTYVTKKDQKRFKINATLYDYQYNHNDKEILFLVLSTVEKTKTIIHKTNETDVFKILIIDLREYGEKEVTNNIKKKISNKEELTSKNSILLALTPVAADKSKRVYQIKETFDLITKAIFADSEARNSAYGATLMFANMILDKNNELIEKIRVIK